MVRFSSLGRRKARAMAQMPPFCYVLPRNRLSRIIRGPRTKSRRLLRRKSIPVATEKCSSAQKLDLARVIKISPGQKSMKPPEVHVASVHDAISARIQGQITGYGISQI
jgi:hypothetical protein